MSSKEGTSEVGEKPPMPSEEQNPDPAQVDDSAKAPVEEVAAPAADSSANYGILAVLFGWLISVFHLLTGSLFVSNPQALADRKKKAAEEKKRLEDDIEEIKSQHEGEVSGLKDKLRQQKSSTNATMAEQIQQLEAELSKEWQDKCDRLVTAANEKHQRELRELNEEKALIEQKVNAMEKKIASQKASSAAGEKKTSALQEQVDELKVWKEKYDNLRSQAASMKERYETRIRELAEERDNALDKMQDAIKKSSVGVHGTVDKQQQVQEVKKIMNQVYHSLRAEFEADKSYKGTSIHSVVMQTIKDTTLKLVQDKEEEEESEEELEEEVIQPQSSSVQLAAKEDVIQVQKQSTTAAKPPSKAAGAKKKKVPTATLR